MRNSGTGSQVGEVRGFTMARSFGARIRRWHWAAWSAAAVVLACNSDGGTAISTLNRVALIAVSLANGRITVGERMQAGVTLRDASGVAVTGKPILWKSSNSSVASVDVNSGVVLALSAGSTVITATADWASCSCNLTVTANAAPVAVVVVHVSTPTLVVGATATATAVVINTLGDTVTDRVVRWSSSAPDVVSIDDAGTIAGLVPGTATIAALVDGLTSTAPIAVTATVTPVANVAVTVATPTIIVGASTQATATVHDASGNLLTGRTATWSSSNAAVATVSADGHVTAVAPGTASITATSEGQSGSATLTVTPAPQVAVATVSVSLTASTLVAGTTTQATAVARDASGNVLTGRPVSWSTSDPATATIDATTGVVTANRAGAVLVTATVDGQTGNATLTVTAASAPPPPPPPPASVATVGVSLSAASINVGATTQATATTKDASGNVLTGRTIVWSSSNTSVAAVDGSSGVVTAVAVGTASIVATSEGKTGSATVTVTTAAPVPVATVSVSLAASSLVAGATTQATATARDASGNVLTGRTVAWSSSNTSVATVDGASGVVTAVAAGTATITATSEGKSGSRSLTVTAVPPVPVATVSVGLADATLFVGATTQATATTADASGNVLTGRVVSWSSSNTSVATVSSSGVVTAVGAGTANIVATSESKIGSAVVTVSVVPVSTVSVALGTSSIQVGNTTQATATARDANGNVLTGRAVTWASSNTSVATVSATGVVTGVVAGTATITATSEGKTGGATVTVTAPPPPPIATQLGITSPPPSAVTTGVAFGPIVVQLRDASGNPVAQAGVTVSISATGGLAVLTGSGSATTNASGAASFSSLVLTGVGSVALQFTASGLSPATSSPISVNALGSFPIPDVLNNASFETGFDGFLNTSLQPSPTGVTRDCTTASDGSCSVKRSWVPASGDVGSQFLAHVGSVDHVWVRFYFKLTSPVSTIMKFARFYDSSIATNFGGLFLKSGNNIFSFGTDQENSAVVTTIGLTQAQVIDGNWHSLEFEYWRNGDPSGYPSAAFWFDGNQVSMPDGPAGLSMFWKSGRLYAGQRNSSVKMSYMGWVGTLNGGNTTTGSVNLDKIAISTLGRIGP